MPFQSFLFDPSLSQDLLIQGQLTRGLNGLLQAARSPEDVKLDTAIKLATSGAQPDMFNALMDVEYPLASRVLQNPNVWSGIIQPQAQAQTQPQDQAKKQPLSLTAEQMKQLMALMPQYTPPEMPRIGAPSASQVSLKGDYAMPARRRTGLYELLMGVK